MDRGTLAAYMRGVIAALRDEAVVVIVLDETRTAHMHVINDGEVCAVALPYLVLKPNVSVQYAYVDVSLEEFTAVANLVARVTLARGIEGGSYGVRGKHVYVFRTDTDFDKLDDFLMYFTTTTGWGARELIGGPFIGVHRAIAA